MKLSMVFICSLLMCAAVFTTTACSPAEEVTVRRKLDTGAIAREKDEVRQEGEFVIVRVTLNTTGGQLKESQLLDMGHLRTLVALKKAYPKMPATVTLAQVGRKDEMVDGTNTYRLETKYKLADILNACE